MTRRWLLRSFAGRAKSAGIFCSTGTRAWRGGGAWIVVGLGATKTAKKSKSYDVKHHDQMHAEKEKPQKREGKAKAGGGREKGGERGRRKEGRRPTAAPNPFLPFLSPPPPKPMKYPLRVPFFFFFSPFSPFFLQRFSRSPVSPQFFFSFYLLLSSCSSTLGWGGGVWVGVGVAREGMGR